MGPKYLVVNFLMLICSTTVCQIEWFKQTGLTTLSIKSAIDKDGNIYILSDGKINKFDNQGSSVSEFTIPPSLNISQFKITDQNILLIGGTYSGTVVFQNKTCESVNGSRDVCIFSLDVDYHLIWAKTFGSKSDDALNSLAVNGNGEIFTCGSLGDSVSVDGFDLNYGSYNWSHSFVAKHANNGHIIWVKTDSSSIPEKNSFFRDLTVGKDGDIVLNGSVPPAGDQDVYKYYFNDSTYLIPSDYGYGNKYSIGMKMSSNGQMEWAVGNLDDNYSTYRTYFALNALSSYRYWNYGYPYGGSCEIVRLNSAGIGTATYNMAGYAYPLGIYETPFMISQWTTYDQYGEHHPIGISVINFEGEKELFRLDGFIHSGQILKNNGNCYITGAFYTILGLPTQTVTAPGNSVFIAKLNCSALALNANFNLKECEIETFPNPASDFCMISTSGYSGLALCDIYTSLGEKVASVQWMACEQNAYKLPISDYPKGILFLRLKLGQEIFVRNLATD